MMDDYYENEKKFQDKANRLRESKDRFSKNKLSKTVEISLNTTAIGALSDFEHYFGELFGYGLEYNDLTDNQKNMRKKWSECRNSILRRAANGVKISLNEIERCSIKEYQEKRYNITIKNKDRNNG